MADRNPMLWHEVENLLNFIPIICLNVTIFWFVFSKLLLLQEPWDQHPLVSNACLVMSFHLLWSWVKLFSSCSPVLHQLTLSSIHSLHGLSLLFVPSTIPNISVFNFLLSSILHMWPNSQSFWISLCGRSFSILSFSTHFTVCFSLYPTDT